MARKRKDFGTEGERRLESMMAAGEPAERIAEALCAMGVQVSRSTVDLRMRARRGAVQARIPVGPSFAAEVLALTPAADAPPGDEKGLPASPEDIEGADVGTLDRWLARAEEAGRKAVEAGNLAAIGAMGRLAVTLQEAKRKAEPPPVQDPNESPDMVRLGKEVAERLHRMVDLVVGE